MNGPDERFAIVPLPPDPAPAESIVVGPMSEVMKYISQSIPRIEEEQRLAQAQRDAAETERFHDEVRTRAAQILADGITRLNERIDQYEDRKQERADQLQREAEEAEAERVELMLAELPDPDQMTMGDDGDFQAIKPAPDVEHLDPEHRNEDLTGVLPKEVDKGVPPLPGDYTPTLPPPPKYRDPTVIGGN